MISPDGHWIAYESYESGDGLQQAYVAEFPGGGKRRQVSTIQADLIRWNANGKELFLASRTRLMAVAVRVSAGVLEVDPPKLLFTMPINCAAVEVNCFDVTSDGQRFLVIDPVGSAPLVTLVQNWTAGLKK